MAMEFETKLSPEIIRQRLSAGTRPMNFANGLSEHRLLFKWNKNNTFYLFKTGGIFFASPTLPFVGRIETRDGATYIIGEFTLAKAATITLACFFGFTWISILCGCFLNPNYDVPGKVFVFTAVAIWTVLGCLFFRFVPNRFQRKQQEEVVEYIRENLME